MEYALRVAWLYVTAFPAWVIRRHPVATVLLIATNVATFWIARR